MLQPIMLEHEYKDLSRAEITLFTGGFLASDFHAAQPLSHEEKKSAPQGGQTGVDGADGGKSPIQFGGNDLTTPKSDPGQEDIQEELL